MPETVYCVDKRSGTSADTLLAVGFAEVLRTLSEGDIHLRDRGGYYELRLSQPLPDSARLSNSLNLIPPIATTSQDVHDGFPYEQEREKRDAYINKRGELPPGLRGPEAWLDNAPELEALLPNKPDARLPLYLAINQILKGPDSFNDPIMAWLRLPADLKQRLVELLLRLFGGHPNPYEAVNAEWERIAKEHGLKKVMTMLQVINPTTGKGANRPKADKLQPRNLEAWWVLEWLKFIGFFRLAHPQAIRDSKDRKTYVVKPRDIGFDALIAVVSAFREVVWDNTPAKMDVVAMLRLVQVLIRHEKLALAAPTANPRRRPRPVDQIHGAEVTFYKNMGNAYAVMNVAALNLPGWIPELVSFEQAERIELSIKEHIAVVQSIQARDGRKRNVERSEEYQLLTRYRDFLSSHTVEPLLDFCALFAPYLSQKIERGDYYRRFSIEALMEVFRMHKPLTQIIESVGFQRIASAIRQCTVTLQINKAHKRPVNFEIRYGLTQELIRRSNHSDDFIAALTEFIARYNAESAQKLETSKGVIVRGRLAQDDLNDMVALLDAGYKPAVIARLLVAYGTAKKERKDQDSSSDDPAAADPTDAANTPSDEE